MLSLLFLSPGVVCYERRGNPSSMLIPGICDDSAGAAGSLCNGGGHESKDRDKMEGTKERESPKASEGGDSIFQLVPYFAVSRAPFPVSPGVDLAVEPPWDR